MYQRALVKPQQAHIVHGPFPPVRVMGKEADRPVAYHVHPTIFLIILGGSTAKTGGSSIGRAVLRVTFWGTVAMGLTALVGYMFNVNVG